MLNFILGLITGSLITAYILIRFFVKKAIEHFKRFKKDYHNDLAKRNNFSRGIHN